MPAGCRSCVSAPIGEREDGRLGEFAGEAEPHPRALTHLVGGCDAQTQRRGAHLETELTGGESDRRHLLDVPAELVSRSRDLLVGIDQLCGRVKPAQVLVAGPIAEPATHLQQGVVGFSEAQVVAHRKALKGEATRQLLPADSDDVHACVPVRVVVQHVLGHPIDGLDLELLDCRENFGRGLLPRQSFGLVRGEEGSGGLEVLLPQNPQFVHVRMGCVPVAVPEAVPEQPDVVVDLIPYLPLHLGEAGYVHQHRVVDIHLPPRAAGGTGQDERMDGAPQ